MCKNRTIYNMLVNDEQKEGIEMHGNSFSFHGHVIFRNLTPGLKINFKVLPVG